MKFQYERTVVTAEHRQSQVSLKSSFLFSSPDGPETATVEIAADPELLTQITTQLGPVLEVLSKAVKGGAE